MHFTRRFIPNLEIKLAKKEKNNLQRPCTYDTVYMVMKRTTAEQKERK